MKFKISYFSLNFTFSFNISRFQMHVGRALDATGLTGRLGSWDAELQGLWEEE